MNLDIPRALDRKIDELISHYPVKRSALLMVLHALQEHIGFLPRPAIEWTARKLNLTPINVYELVTFYPMFRSESVGQFQLKICRTLSCALGGAHALHHHFCEKLGLDPECREPQTTEDGRFTVEFVECLASCDTAPVMLCNDTYHEGMDKEKAGEVLQTCQRRVAAEHGFEP